MSVDEFGALRFSLEFDVDHFEFRLKNVLALIINSISSFRFSFSLPRSPTPQARYPSPTKDHKLPPSRLALGT